MIIIVGVWSLDRIWYRYLISDRSRIIISYHTNVTNHESFLFLLVSQTPDFYRNWRRRHPWDSMHHTSLCTFPSDLSPKLLSFWTKHRLNWKELWRWVFVLLSEWFGDCILVEHDSWNARLFFGDRRGYFISSLSCTIAHTKRLWITVVLTPTCQEL